MLGSLMQMAELTADEGCSRTDWNPCRGLFCPSSDFLFLGAPNSVVDLPNALLHLIRLSRVLVRFSQPTQRLQPLPHMRRQVVLPRLSQLWRQQQHCALFQLLQFLCFSVIRDERLP
mmetsp:Transcript_88/g.237  ORF Transcript_88/g.237 Transcript_88/m.237 type:complete len:117 (+) Transcript_88:601-951(+)